MKMKNFILSYLVILLFFGCKKNIKVKEIQNRQQGYLKATVGLQIVAEKKFELDSITAPGAEYSQIYTDSSGNRYFTFLNKSNNTIYFYNYGTNNFIKKILISGNEIRPTAYFIKSPDSIYIFDKKEFNVFRINKNGKLSAEKKSLIGNNKPRNLGWLSDYPQYNPRTTVPFLLKGNSLIFPGQYMDTPPDSLVDKFRFITYIDVNSNKVNYYHPYPKDLYGDNYNWIGEPFTEAYIDFGSNEDELIFSFPISHQLYISKLQSNIYTTVYGGSNEAGTISSINLPPNHVTREKIKDYFLKTDEYGAIKYDPYRKVYYRLLMKAIPNVNVNTQFQQKLINIIIMDEKFKYLGETTIGKWKNWFIQNVFVTKEGLNIEYIQNKLSENYLTLKIFNIKPKS